MKRQSAVFFVASFALLALLFVPNFVRKDAPYALSTIDIADTEEKRVAGLSGMEVPPDYGMLFVFPAPGSYGFWMKDMLAPIDIIWLSEKGAILGIHENVSPDSYPEVFYPPSPVRFVLEVAAGTADARGWEVGTVLSLPLR